MPHHRWLALFLFTCALSVHVSAAACPRDSANDKICAGHGTCTARNQCQCDDRHTGFDCSQVLCPSGFAWAAPARATDDAHYSMECSNRGICDRATGECVCMEGYGGTACQRLLCSGNCGDGGGECMSLKQLSRMYAVATEPIYNVVWDADMMYGCHCRRGFRDYDCSRRSCPSGDDPLTTGQRNEVQILWCTGKSGYFHLFFNGEGTTVPYDATETQFVAALRKLERVPTVKVTYSDGTTACSDTRTNAILLEFTHAFGPQPPFKVFTGLHGVVSLQGGEVFAASNGAVLAGRVSVTGTKESLPCSNRGFCDESMGKCYCYLSPLPGFRSSDGMGNPGTRGDCGCVDNGGPVTSCPGELPCSGHGYCSGGPSYNCVCEKGWTSGDCSVRSCPQGFSWFAIPKQNVVHNQLATCSNAGRCDITTGECHCYSPFTGNACDLMRCPGDTPCNGRGQCMSIRQLSLEASVNYPELQFDYGTDPNNANTYDRDSILGCKCDPGYQGYDCSQRSCPRGDDPTTTGQVDEVQVIQCIATGGSFQLQYRLQASSDIPFDATANQFRSILLSSLDLEDVLINYSVGQSACSSASSGSPNVISITFLIDHGDLPALRGITSFLFTDALDPASALTVADNGASLGGISSRTGTKENSECSGKGICNYNTGQCICSAGYGSSDGRGNVGTRGDCGILLERVHKFQAY